jgi:hypothetical protein
MRFLAKQSQFVKTSGRAIAKRSQFDLRGAGLGGDFEIITKRSQFDDPF